NDLILNCSFLDDGLADIASRHYICAELGHQVLEVGDELETTIKIGPDRIKLAEVDNCRGHEAKQVEGHLLLRKGTDTQLLHALSDHVVAAHQASPTRPANDCTADG